jgi:hypothetical protein
VIGAISRSVRKPVATDNSDRPTSAIETIAIVVSETTMIGG